jgi:hypothetical protein
MLFQTIGSCKTFEKSITERLEQNGICSIFGRQAQFPLTSNAVKESSKLTGVCSSFFQVSTSLMPILSLFHYRNFLYRPMLARFYSMKSETVTLSDRLLRESAGMCVETAQKIVALIVETLEPEEPIGLIPWWYRIYYLHIAGTNLLAAMFRADLYTESVAHSWSAVISALRAHEHLSTYIQQCVWTFELLSSRILATRFPDAAIVDSSTLEEGTSGLFEDVFQDMDFDFDSFLFRADDLLGGQD